MKRLFIGLLIGACIYSCSSSKEAAQDQATAQVQQRGEGERRQGPPSIEEVFKMDADGDGLLAKSEIKGRLLERFDEIDTDKDGFISKEELAKAPKPNRRRGQRN